LLAITEEIYVLLLSDISKPPHPLLLGYQVAISPW
jgi:hypothetical protein